MTDKISSIQNTKVRSTELLRILIIALTVAALDQWTKHLVSADFTQGEVRNIIPGVFNIVLTHNKGVAFGIFSEIGSDLFRYLVLGATTFLAILAVVYFAKSEYGHSSLARTAIAMILGGAIGNIIDRVRFGAVTDFLDFYVGEYHWPAFNIADSAICIAVFILIFFTNSGSDSQQGTKFH